MINFLDENDFNELIKNDTPVLIEFWSYDCVACNKANPFLFELEEAYYPKLKIYKIDVQKNIFCIQRYNIKSVPTFIMFKNNEILFRIEGFKDRNHLEKNIRQFIKLNKRG